MPRKPLRAIAAGPYPILTLVLALIIPLLFVTDVLLKLWESLGLTLRFAAWVRQFITTEPFYALMVAIAVVAGGITAIVLRQIRHRESVSLRAPRIQSL